MKKNKEFTVKYPIRDKLILYILIPLVIVFSFILIFSYIKGRDNALFHTKEYLEELTGHHAAKLDSIFNSVAFEAKSIADVIASVSDISHEDIFELIKNKIKSNEYVYGMALAYTPSWTLSEKKIYSPYFFRKDDTILFLDLAESYDYTVSDWFRIPKRIKKPYWTEPYYDEGGGDELMITYSYPIISENNVIAIATADISLSRLKKKVDEISIMAGYTFIVARTGTFIYHPNDDYVMNETLYSLAQFHNIPEARVEIKEILKGIGGIMEFSDFESGDTTWLVYEPIESCGWSFIAVIPEREILNTVHSSLRYQLIIILSGMLIIVFIMIWVSYGITKPIKILINYAEGVSSGNLDLNISHIRSKDEIGELAFILNKMSKDLKCHINDLLFVTKAKESVESELRIARKIQESLLPRIFPPFPEIKEIELYAKNIPAKEVAGDFYDFYKINDNKLALIIADVSGKGISAGLYMVIARTLMKLMCQKEGSQPFLVMNEANRILCQDNESCMFITLFLAFYDIRTGELIYANAGHKGSNILSLDGSIRELKSLRNMAMGISETESYTQGKTHLKPGEILTLFTDGITEATSSNNDLFGEERFFNIIHKNIHKSLQEISNIICDDIMEFQDHEKFDDITLLLLKRRI